jgi:ribosome-associated toxin RatA of RatAB toxin-antitoxin module
MAGVALLAAAMCMRPAAAQDGRLSANVRAGGIDSRQREQAGSRIRRSRAVGLVRASVDQVTEVILDYAGYRRFMPHFVASRVLSQRGSQALVYIEVSALNGLAKLWAEMQIRMVPAAVDSPRVVRARMIKGNLKGFEAEWQITPINPAHTLVAFELCADPDFQLPFATGIVSDYNEKEARDSLAALRKRMARPSDTAAR